MSILCIIGLVLAVAFLIALSPYLLFIIGFAIGMVASGDPVVGIAAGVAGGLVGVCMVRAMRGDNDDTD